MSDSQPERLYHYCSELNARNIIESEPAYYLVGTGSLHGWGMYATDIEPINEESMDDVSTHCFGGNATHAELSHVLVLHPGNAVDRFEQTSNPYEWIIDREAPEAIIELETLLLEVRRWEDPGWSVMWRNPDM